MVCTEKFDLAYLVKNSLKHIFFSQSRIYSYTSIVTFNYLTHEVTCVICILDHDLLFSTEPKYCPSVSPTHKVPLKELVCHCQPRGVAQNTCFNKTKLLANANTPEGSK